MYLPLHKLWTDYMCQMLNLEANRYKLLTFLLLTVSSPKFDKFSKITNWVRLKNKQHHSKVLLNCFPVSGSVHRVLSIGFCP